jgi:putative membrane protein
MGMMVTDHEKTVALFKEGTQNRDAGLKQLATKTLTVIQQHDEMAKKIASALK